MNRPTRILPVALAALLLGGTARGEEAAPPCHGPGASAPAPAAASSTARVEVPDVALVDQDGKTVRLQSLLAAGKPVVVSFIFTTCTTVCPMLSTIVSRVQKDLGARSGTEVSLVSISVDPARDTPARLKAYAARHHAGPGWTWLTGDRGTVEQVLRGMGAYTPSFADHPPMVLVGNGSGEWTRLNGFPSQAAIVSQIDTYAASRAKPVVTARGS